MSNKENVSKSGTSAKTVIFDECHSCQLKQKGCHSPCKAHLSLKKGKAVTAYKTNEN